MANQEKTPTFDFGGIIGRVSLDPETLCERVKDAFADGLPIVDLPKVDCEQVGDDVFEFKVTLKPVLPVEYVETTLTYERRIPNIEQQEFKF